jgi:hypothetical protein
MQTDVRIWEMVRQIELDLALRRQQRLAQLGPLPSPSRGFLRRSTRAVGAIARRGFDRVGWFRDAGRPLRRPSGWRDRVLQVQGFIELPGPRPTSFDHGAFDAETGRVFVAHTAADSVEVLDAHNGRHERTLAGYPEAAGVVAGDGLVAVTNRGAASLSIVDAATLVCRATVPTSPRPNGVALAPRHDVAVAACIGTDEIRPTLDRVELRTGSRVTLPLPGRPRWCVVDNVDERLFCAIREPSMVLVVDLATFVEAARWPLPSEGAHGIDIDPVAGRLFVACDGGHLVALDAATGAVSEQWPLPGVPDATFCNSATGRVHVAVGDPGAIVSVDTRTGRVSTTATEVGAKTTAFAPPDRLFVFLPTRGGALEFIDQPN